LIGCTPRNGVYPELVTLRCVACANLFTTPGDSQRRIPDLLASSVDMASIAAPAGQRFDHLAA
jgi:hypothetical protein